MLNCKGFARQLVERGAERLLRPEMFRPRVAAWVGRPIRPLLDDDRIRRIKWHLKHSFRADPEAYGLPADRGLQPKPVVPRVRQPFNAIAVLRRHARQQFVQQQLARMDDTIAEWREKRRLVRKELGNRSPLLSDCRSSKPP